MNQKEKAAQYTFEKIEKKFHKDFILGIGTGSTTNCFIEILKEKKPEMKCFVSSSSASSDLLKDAGYIDAELNDVGGPDIYVDGADEVNSKFELIKGGGGGQSFYATAGGSDSSGLSKIKDKAKSLFS